MGTSQITAESLQRILAAYLLSVQVGERLPTIRELAKKYHSSVGSMSNALNYLEESGAIEIERRGHLGSFLRCRKVGELWWIAEHSPFIVSFPLPTVFLLEGLATAIKSLLTHAGLDVYLTFIRGSRTRLKALRANKCHLSVMSAFAAQELADAKQEMSLKLPPRTYVREHMVFYRPERTNPAARLRVGIDWDSFDVHRLVELEYADQDVDLKSTSYMQIPRLLAGDQIDAALWSIDDMEVHVGERIFARSLSPRVHEAVAHSDTAATLVYQSDQASVSAVIAESIDIEQLLRIQEKVMRGEMLPEY